MGKSATVSKNREKDAAIAEGLNALAKIDHDVGARLNMEAIPRARSAPATFSTLARIVIGQQVSTKAAATVFARLETVCGQVDAGSVYHLGRNGLREVGLSGRKCDYLWALAEQIVQGDLDIHAWTRMSDKAAIDDICRLRGFGRWSADIYLMFALDRMDVMPADDLALRIAYKNLKRLEAVPTAKQLRHATEAWCPYRSAGAHFLWQLYGSATLAGNTAHPP